MPLDLSAPHDKGYKLLQDFITKDTVITFKGVLYKVTKVNPVKYQVIDESGNRFTIRRDSSGVKRAPRQADFDGPETNVFKSEFKLGSTARLKSDEMKRKYGDEIYVIIALTAGDTFRLAQLGGTPSNTYLKGFMATDLELVKGAFKEED